MPGSDRIVRRPGLSAAAPAASLNRLTEVESAAATSCGCAPIRRAILAPTRAGASIQPWAFQPRIRLSPHSDLTTSLQARGHGLGQGAQGIAVEIDHALGQGEPLSEGGEGIGPVQGQGVVARHASSRSTALTGEASRPTSGKGRAISS